VATKNFKLPGDVRYVLGEEATAHVDTHPGGLASNHSDRIVGCSIARLSEMIFGAIVLDRLSDLDTVNVHAVQADDIGLFQQFAVLGSGRDVGKMLCHC
jgi:hypothetical protein